MGTHVKRAYRYRFHPTDAQAAELSRTFGCVRKVYNLALAARTEAWTRQERVNYHQTSAMLTAWKKAEELSFLNDVSSVPLQQALRHLQTAFTHFFGKRAKYPRFKSRKKTRRSAEYTTSAFRFRDGALTLAKMTEPLALVWSRPLPEGAKPSTVTLSQDSARRWFVSLLCEDPSVKPLPATGQAVGVDVGLDHLLTLSTGEKIANPRHERRDRASLAREQRRLAKKEKVFTDDLLTRCEEIMRDVCTDFGGGLREFNGERDHVHLLVHYPPKVALSRLVGSLKGVSARRLRQEFPDHLRRYLWGDHFWSPSYFAASAGGAPLSVVKEYIENQKRPD